MRNQILFAFLAITTSGFCQIPVTDVALNASFEAKALTEKFTEQKRSMLEKLRHSETIQQWHQNLTTARNVLATARETRSQIEGLVNLQKELQRSWTNVENIGKFTAADINFYLKYLLDIDLDPTAYIPYTPWTKDFISETRSAFGTPSNARRIFAINNSIHRYYLGLVDYRDLARDRFGTENIEGKVYSQVVDEHHAVATSLEENYGMLLMERFSMINEEMEKKLRKADELRSIANDAQAQMPAADRARMLTEANDLLDEIFKLKLESHNILYRIQTFEQRPITERLFEENENYIVNRRLTSVAYSKINVFSQMNNSNLP